MMPAIAFVAIFCHFIGIVFAAVSGSFVQEKKLREAGVAMFFSLLAHFIGVSAMGVAFAVATP
jgi:hypothetical protein